MSFNKVIIPSVFSLILLLASTIYSQEKMEVVDNSVFLKPQRPPSVFCHDTHNEKAEIDNCSVCHHVYDKKGDRIWVESSEDQFCYECHFNGVKEDENKLRRLFHIACNTCHRKEKRGPVSCGHCHLNSKK